jgi:pimeloyl-ACP methyl ester carboxylesterase
LLPLLSFAVCLIVHPGAAASLPPDPRPITAARPGSHALALSSCTLPGLARPARCGVLDVPENPDRPNGRRLPIHVAVVPARADSPRKDPIAVLMGGPGEDAISAAALFAERFAPLLDERELLLVDQRGTGRSGSLQCALYSPEEEAANLVEFVPPAAVERCLRGLRTRADLTQYTYARFASDLEAVRLALAYDPLNLFAGSYGTRAAQVYLRAHPDSVRTAYLGSVVPIDVATPLPMARAAQAALEKTFDACAADGKCHAAFPNLRDEFRDVAARLESGAVRVAVAGIQGKVPLHRGRVAEALRTMLYRAEGAADVPWTIHRAYVGDWGPLVANVLSSIRGRDSAISFGLFFSITCSEDVPFIREEEIVRETQGTLLGDFRVRQQQAACREWPKAPLLASDRTRVRSSVPTLFVSGDTDPASPLWYVERVAAGFSERVEVVLRDQGHTEWTDCVARLYERLVRSGSVRGLDPSCAPVPRPAFRTR